MKKSISKQITAPLQPLLATWVSADDRAELDTQARADTQARIDTHAWRLVNQRSPFLARAVYHLLESGSPTGEVLDTARSNCADPRLRPMLACAVYGCVHLRNTDRAALFGASWPEESSRRIH